MIECLECITMSLFGPPQVAQLLQDLRDRHNLLRSHRLRTPLAPPLPRKKIVVHPVFLPALPNHDCSTLGWPIDWLFPDQLYCVTTSLSGCWNGYELATSLHVSGCHFGSSARMGNQARIATAATVEDWTQIECRRRCWPRSLSSMDYAIG